MVATSYVHVNFFLDCYPWMAQTLFLLAHAEILHPLHKQLQLLARQLSRWEVTVTVAGGIDFRYTLCKDGCPYSTINTARSALSIVVFLP